MPLLAFPSYLFLEFCEGTLRVHNSMETIVVIALSEAGYYSFSGRIFNERQRLIQVFLQIASIAPLRSISGFFLPVPAQTQRNSLPRHSIADNHASFEH